MQKIVVVDYGMGNLRSVAQALRAVAPEAEVLISGDPEQIRAAERIVLPGQGAMPDCMRSLQESGVQEAVLEASRSKPMFGVCVGEQMLFDVSEEGNTCIQLLLACTIKINCNADLRFTGIAGDRRNAVF